MNLFIPRDREAHNVLIAGAAGTRKSSVIRDLMDQAMDRAWPCVITDLKCEFVAEYYRPGIDYLVNFADERCVRVAFHREARNRVESRAIANGAVVDVPNDVPFFKQHTRSIFAFMLGDLHLTASEIAYLTSYPSELDKVLKGTKYAALLSSDSGDIRGGILGNLALVGDALSVLPDEDGRQELCIREWAAQGKERRGNIFLCSTRVSFSAQRHLQSLLIDMLLLAVQTYPGPAMFFLDEVGVFGKIPQLDDALSFQRSSGNPIVISFQAFGQLREHYGIEKAKSIVSNPYTRLCLRMNEPTEAEYASKLLGMPAERERIRESRSKHFWTRHNHNYSTEMPMVSPVTAGEIQELEDGKGYLAQAGKITRVHLRYRPPIEKQSRLIERTTWPAHKPPPPSTDDESKNGPRYASRYTQRKLKLESPANIT